VDLAKGHIAALSYMFKNKKNKIETFNLGTGNGYSVLEMVKKFEETSNLKIPYKFTERRKGDVSECWADPNKALLLLNWEAEFNLEKMMVDLWNWQKKNPNGYE
jgi:UDP-glucose 4-epimerase